MPAGVFYPGVPFNPAAIVAMPKFDVVPIIQDRSGVFIGFATIAGLSTKHDSTDTDNGRIYFNVLQAGGEYVVTLFNDPTYLVGSEIASGSGTIGNLFQLAEENASGVTARIRLDGAGASANGIIIPTFALDVDVFKNQNDAAAMPGYDPDYGLAMFHAAAMRRIMTSDLPSALPDLYRNSGLSAFVPLGSAVTLPDLSTIESPEALRDAQANLVKSLSAQESEHLEAFAEMADAARARFVTALAAFKAANAPKAEEKAATANTISMGYFIRG
jgi:hypothetical protein